MCCTHKKNDMAPPSEKPNCFQTTNMTISVDNTFTLMNTQHDMMLTFTVGNVFVISLFIVLKQVIMAEFSDYNFGSCVRYQDCGPICHPEKEPGAPAVGVNHWWETRDAITTCPVHVWLSH